MPQLQIRKVNRWKIFQKIKEKIVNQAKKMLKYTKFHLNVHNKYS